MADVLKVQELARFKLKRNATILYDQAFAPAEEDFTEHTGDRVILATNMAAPQEINLAGVATGGHLMLETDREILVTLDVTTSKWQVGNGSALGALLFVGSFTHVYLQNENTTNTATVSYIITD